MQEKVLTAMAKEDAFCRAEIEWCKIPDPYFTDEKNAPPYWIVFFCSANDPKLRYPLHTARKAERHFKTTDAALKAIGKITAGRLRDIRIIPSPWWDW